MEGTWDVSQHPLYLKNAESSRNGQSLIRGAFHPPVNGEHRTSVLFPLLDPQLRRGKEALHTGSCILPAPTWVSACQQGKPLGRPRSPLQTGWPSSLPHPQFLISSPLSASGLASASRPPRVLWLPTTSSLPARPLQSWVLTGGPRRPQVCPLFPGLHLLPEPR